MQRVKPTKQGSDVYLAEPVCSMQTSFTFYRKENVKLLCIFLIMLLNPIQATYTWVSLAKQIVRSLDLQISKPMKRFL